MLAEKDRVLGLGDAAPGEVDGDVLLVAGVELPPQSGKSAPGQSPSSNNGPLLSGDLENGLVVTSRMMVYLIAHL